MYDLVKTLHLLASLTWVGGMFFAWMILRPAAMALAPPERLGLWRRVLDNFFHPWVWLSVVLLPLTGYVMIFVWLGGFAYTYLYVHIMHGLGLVMIALFCWLYFGPWRQLRAAVDAADWPQAGQQLARIRRIVGSNLLIGLLTIIIAAAGRSWIPG